MKNLMWIYVCAALCIWGMYNLHHLDLPPGLLILQAGLVAIAGWAMVVLFWGWVEVEERRATPVTITFYRTRHLWRAWVKNSMVRVCGWDELSVPENARAVRLQVSALPIPGGRRYRVSRFSLYALEDGNVWHLVVYPEVVATLFDIFPHAVWTLRFYVKIVEVV